MRLLRVREVEIDLWDCCGPRNVLMGLLWTTECVYEIVVIQVRGWWDYYESGEKLMG